MGSRGRIGLGGLFVALGIVAWLAVWSKLGPVPVGEPATVSSMPDGLGDQMTSVAARWSAVALAVGGLVLAARVWRAGVALAVGLGVAWLAADAILDLSDIDTQVGPAASVPIVAVAAVALLVAARRRGTGSGPAWSLLVFAGVLICLTADPNVALEIGRDAGWLLLALHVAAMPVAAILALAAGPSPPSRLRAWGVTVAVVAYAGATVALGWLAAAAVNAGVSLWAWPGIGFLMLPLVLPATLVALTGVPVRRGRGVVAYAGLVLGGVVVGGPFLLAAVYPWPSDLGVGGRGLTAAWAVPAGVALSGALLGAVMVVGASVLRRGARPEPPASLALANDRRSAAASLAGVLLAVAGVAAWVVMALDLQARIAALVAEWSNTVHPRYGRGYLEYGLQGAHDFEGLGWDLRWAAIVLAASGLRLLVRGRIAGRLLVVGVMAWFAVDVLLVATVLVPRAAAVWVVALVAGVALAGAVVLLARARGPVPAGQGRAFVYSGGLMGVALFLFDGPESWMANYVSFVPPAALTALLVVAAVVTALLARPGRPGWNRVGSAFGLAAVGVAAVLMLDRWRLMVSVPERVWMLAGGLVLAGLVLGCALLAGVVPSRGAGWRLAGLVGVAAPMVLIGASATAGLIVGGGVTSIGGANATGPFALDDTAVPLTLYGVCAGSTLAVLALLPRALSTLPAAARRPDPEPVPKSARPALAAVPGVPEVLQWPPPRTPA